MVLIQNLSDLTGSFNNQVDKVKEDLIGDSITQANKVKEDRRDYRTRKA
jgi:sec-independent protein translocase protein TatA